MLRASLVLRRNLAFPPATVTRYPGRQLNFQRNVVFQRSTLSTAAPMAEPVQDYSSRRIDGNAIAKQVRGEVRQEVENMVAKHNTHPGLAVVLVGNRPDSATYVRMKKKAASEAGIYSEDVQMEESATQEEILEKIKQLNADDKIHGILVQLPLPKHVNESVVLDAIAVDKDVDGFSAVNIGNLCLKGGSPPLAIPCTPAGCVQLLQRSVPEGYTFAGKTAVVVGRSNIVGMPMAQLLTSMDCTVTVCHSRTTNTAEIVSTADILVAAVGRAEYIKGDWIKPGAIVIDVGINAVDDPSKKRGYRLVGDVEYDKALEVCGKITPVPGGVGPMTIAMLLFNTVNLARNKLGLERLHLRSNKYAH